MLYMSMLCASYSIGYMIVTSNFDFIQGCKQFGKSLGVPPSCILCGLIILSSFMLSPAQVTVPGTSWAEPVLTWITISMSTGSRKTTIYRLLSRIVKDVKQKVGIEGKLSV